ncbi:hypothetical protein Hdeb2414_s0009g00310451 [Helianthus debilis subsp. tardiflorus]
MVRVRHYVFTCRSQGQDPTVERFRVFYQLQCNLGFYSFASRDATKKILINPPKSYHDWKGNFFYTREEVIPVATDFRVPGTIEKETLVVPKDVGWYKDLKALSNQSFGENTLVAIGMKDKCLRESLEIDLYHRAFLACAGTMGVRPLHNGEQLWYDQIRENFMYPRVDLFVAPPAGNEGALYLNPRPCRAITPAGEEVVLLSSEESLASSD